MSGAADSDEKVNMVPLIDCMFFLIMFFMLVTKFTPDEKAIASLLPTDKGQFGKPPPDKKILEQVNIAIYPAGMEKGLQPSEYRAAFEKQIADGTFDKQVWLRIGGNAPVLIEGQYLSQIKMGSPEMRDQIAKFHAYVGQELGKLELAGGRKEQVPVVISCFSGMSWKYAILAYDAVRAYEATKQPKYNKDAFDLEQAREVTFAPPRIRNYSSNELGNELYEIVQLR